VLHQPVSTPLNPNAGSLSNEYLNLRQLLQATSDPSTSGEIVLPKRFVRATRKENINNSQTGVDHTLIRMLDVSEYLVLRRRDRHSKPTEVGGVDK